MGILSIENKWNIFHIRWKYNVQFLTKRKGDTSLLCSGEATRVNYNNYDFPYLAEERWLWVAKAAMIEAWPAAAAALPLAAAVLPAEAAALPRALPLGAAAAPRPVAEPRCRPTIQKMFIGNHETYHELDERLGFMSWYFQGWFWFSWDGFRLKTSRYGQPSTKKTSKSLVAQAPFSYFQQYAWLVQISVLWMKATFIARILRHSVFEQEGKKLSKPAEKKSGLAGFIFLPIGSLLRFFYPKCSVTDKE